MHTITGNNNLAYNCEANYIHIQYNIHGHEFSNIYNHFVSITSGVSYTYTVVNSIEGYENSVVASWNINEYPTVTMVTEAYHEDYGSTTVTFVFSSTNLIISSTNGLVYIDELIGYDQGVAKGVCRDGTGNYSDTGFYYIQSDETIEWVYGYFTLCNNCSSSSSTTSSTSSTTSSSSVAFAEGPYILRCLTDIVKVDNSIIGPHISPFIQENISPVGKAWVFIDNGAGRKPIALQNENIIRNTPEKNPDFAEHLCQNYVRVGNVPVVKAGDYDTYIDVMDIKEVNFVKSACTTVFT